MIARPARITGGHEHDLAFLATIQAAPLGILRRMRADTIADWRYAALNRAIARRTAQGRRWMLALMNIVLDCRRHAGHLEDLDFMASIRTAPMGHLRMLLQWQCAEQWHRVAVTREIDRRSTP